MYSILEVESILHEIRKCLDGVEQRAVVTITVGIQSLTVLSEHESGADESIATHQ